MLSAREEGVRRRCITAEAPGEEDMKRRLHGRQTSRASSVRGARWMPPRPAPWPGEKGVKKGCRAVVLCVGCVGCVQWGASPTCSLVKTWFLRIMEVTVGAMTLIEP